jgi:hypothetical protein
MGLRPGTGDYAVVALVDDAEGLTAYLEHPAHVKAVTERLTPLVLSRQAVQIQTEGR